MARPTFCGAGFLVVALVISGVLSASLAPEPLPPAPQSGTALTSARQNRNWFGDIIGDIGNAVKNGVYWVEGKGCRVAGVLTGWACDDPLSRWLWSIIKNCRGCNCQQICAKTGKRGTCVGGAKDTSTWCPKGQQCRCT